MVYEVINSFDRETFCRQLGIKPTKKEAPFKEDRERWFALRGDREIAKLFGIRLGLGRIPILGYHLTQKGSTLTMDEIEEVFAEMPDFQIDAKKIIKDDFRPNGPFEDIYRFNPISDEPLVYRFERTCSGLPGE